MSQLIGATGKAAGDKRAASHGSGHRAIAPRALAAAFGVGTLIGVSFLALTLMGLEALAWAVLGVVMLWALADTALVAVGGPRVHRFRSLERPRR